MNVASVTDSGSHLELRDMSFKGSWPYVQLLSGADDVTLRNDHVTRFSFAGPSNVNVLGGSYGPADDASNDIGPENTTTTDMPTNILIDGADFPRVPQGRSVTPTSTASTPGA